MEHLGVNCYSEPQVLQEVSTNKWNLGLIFSVLTIWISNFSSLSVSKKPTFSTYHLFSSLLWSQMRVLRQTTTNVFQKKNKSLILAGLLLRRLGLSHIRYWGTNRSSGIRTLWKGFHLKQNWWEMEMQMKAKAEESCACALVAGNRKWTNN